VIAGVVLAAGRATRFGGGKVVASLGRTTLVRHVIDRLREGGVEDVVVVAGVERDRVTEAIAEISVTVVENPSPELGLSSSIRVGVDSLGRDVEAIVIALADQPLIDPAVVRALIDSWERSNAMAVVPVYRDGRGNPVLFDARQREALRGLRGDVGARVLLEHLGEEVRRLLVDADSPRDVDSRDDLRDLERSVAERE
jgi:molybdenum cofactor cytidylyltransferase